MNLYLFNNMLISERIYCASQSLLLLVIISAITLPATAATQAYKTSRPNCNDNFVFTNGWSRGVIADAVNGTQFDQAIIGTVSLQSGLIVGDTNVDRPASLEVINDTLPLSSSAIRLNAGSDSIPDHLKLYCIKQFPA